MGLCCERKEEDPGAVLPQTVVTSGKDWYSTFGKRASATPLGKGSLWGKEVPDTPLSRL